MRLQIATQGHIKGKHTNRTHLIQYHSLDDQCRTIKRE